MNSWLNSVSDPGLIEDVYGSNLPDLNDVEIQDLVLKIESSELILRVNLERFPTSPPNSWSKLSNTVQIEIALAQLSKCSILGVPNEAPVTVLLENGADDGVRLQAVSESARIEAEAKSASLKSLTAYIDERRIPPDSS